MTLLSRKLNFSNKHRCSFAEQPCFNYYNGIAYSIEKKKVEQQTRIDLFLHETRNWVLFSQIPTFSGHLYSWTFTLFAISGYQVLPFPELIIMFGYSWWWLAVRGRHKWVRRGEEENMLFIVHWPPPPFIFLTARGASNQLQSQRVTHWSRWRRQYI